MTPHTESYDIATNLEKTKAKTKKTWAELTLVFVWLWKVFVCFFFLWGEGGMQYLQLHTQ